MYCCFSGDRLLCVECEISSSLNHGERFVNHVQVEPPALLIQMMYRRYTSTLMNAALSLYHICAKFIFSYLILILRYSIYLIVNLLHSFVYLLTNLFVSIYSFIYFILWELVWQGKFTNTHNIFLICIFKSCKHSSNEE